jgi:hypothetical protein
MPLLNATGEELQSIARVLHVQQQREEKFKPPTRPTG